MSQIETVMLVALGFAIATLIALFVGRFAWDLALSIGRRRAQQNTPASLIELQTERDRLRAEHAMLSRKLELKLEDYKTRVVQQMAEVTRNRNRIQNIASEMSSRDAVVAERDKQIAALKERVAALEADLTESAEALQTAMDQIKAQDVEAYRLKGEIEELNLKVAARDLSLEVLQAEIGGRASLPAAGPQDAHAHLRQRIAELKELSQQIAQQRAQLKQNALSDSEAGTPEAKTLAEAGQSLAEKIDDAERDVDELALELKQLDKKWQNRLSGKTKRDDDEDGEEDTKRASDKPFPSLGGVANVISLAQRIRSLKKDITG
jgi:chromosome segregation ATPase